MKKILLFTLLIPLLNWGVAQEYETIVDTTKQWAVVKYWFYDDWPTEDRYKAQTYNYRFNGDTVIGNYKYMFLEICKDSLCQN